MSSIQNSLIVYLCAEDKGSLAYSPSPPVLPEEDFENPGPCPASSHDNHQLYVDENPNDNNSIDIGQVQVKREVSTDTADNMNVPDEIMSSSSSSDEDSASEKAISTRTRQKRKVSNSNSPQQMDSPPPKRSNLRLFEKSPNRSRGALAISMEKQLVNDIQTFQKETFGRSLIIGKMIRVKAHELLLKRSGSSATAACLKFNASRGWLDNFLKKYNLYKVIESWREFCSVLKCADTNCGEEFENRKKLLKHLKSCHENRLGFWCDKCDEGFELEENLEFHRYGHVTLPSEQMRKRVICESCGQSLLEQNYRNHKRHHCTARDWEEMEGAEGSVFCDRCGKRFSNERRLGLHRKGKACLGMRKS